MIIIYHKNNKVVEVEVDGKSVVYFEKEITKNLYEMAISFPDDLLIWCQFDLKSSLNFSGFHDIFHHKKIMSSYNPLSNSLISSAIGYVEESPFININKKVIYPTWQMSSCVGGINASVLLELKKYVFVNDNFEYFLNSIAKLAMNNGLLCYSEPFLLTSFLNGKSSKGGSSFVLFRFVKQHYKMRWVFLLFLNLLLYEKKLSFFPLLFCLFYSKRKLKENCLENIQVQSTNKVVNSGTVDVIIPTIGRKRYLYDVLKDLSAQTYLPISVIIVEQNPDLKSVSELEYLQIEKWPFEIKHVFTHQTGACNARNLAMAQAKSEWVFMADDDIRLKDSFLEESFTQIVRFGTNEITFGCYNSHYAPNKKYSKEMQWETFGSGCSIVKRKPIKDIRYRAGFEFGYGEDSDFGMQLRNEGVDILYFPQPEILHLKAPVGGFRTKPVLEWQNELIQPKPSPTVMLYKKLHVSKEEINGYKTILFIKFYKLQSIKNPIRYFFYFKKQWNQSLYWANKLKDRV